MAGRTKRFLTGLGFAVAAGLTGCSSHDGSILPDEVFSVDPTTASKTKSQDYLESLPPPDETITVSVYSFADYTGQNKPGEVPEYSKAVTQGGLPILKKALMDASSNRWFRVLERGGLQDLLQERQLIRSIREQYAGPDGQKLPDLGPLLYSGLLLEGGIVAYESNVYTGGLGARYLGIGANTEYRRDIVTVYLRAVSVTTGEVLLSVNSSKTIYSTSIQGGIFKYVSFDKIVESEAGYTINEPPQFAVRQAIEMAVYSLIMEGSAKDLWKFQDPAAGARAYNEYLVRKTGHEAEASNKPAAEPVKASSVHESAPPAIESAAAGQKVPWGSEPSAAHNNTPAPKKAEEPKAAAIQAPPPAAKPNPAASLATWTDRAVSSIRHGWYVQYAAVRGADEQKRGGKIISQLEAAGLPVTVHLPDNSDSLYRIMVGPYNDQRVAQSVAKVSWDRLAADGWLFTPPYVKMVP